MDTRSYPLLAARSDHPGAYRRAGVVIDLATGAVDVRASERLRAAKRRPVRMFHRGDYFGPLVSG